MKTLSEVMKDFNKKNKEDLVHFGLSEYNYERIPFTSPRLNYISFGGLPMGKMIEFYGEEHGGKTTTAMDIVSNYQLLDNAKKVLWVDCENTFDNVWAHKLGVNVEEMLMLQPTEQSAEELFQFILDAISTGEIGLVVIDSLGVMYSSQAKDKALTDATYAGISKALTGFGDKAVGLCQRNKCTIIGINQLRDDFNSMFGGTKTVGGRGWKHNVIARFEFRMGDYFDSKGKKLNRSTENPAGNKVLVVMKKNKTCPPTRRTGWYTLTYLDGIDYLSDFVEVCLKCGIVEQSGAWFNIVDIETGEVLKEKLHGQDNVKKYLEEDTELLSRLEDIIERKIKAFDDYTLNNEDELDNEEDV